MDSYDIKKLKGLYALAKYMSSRTDELKEPYVEVLSIDQRKHGTSYIEDEIEPYGTYLTELPELPELPVAASRILRQRATRRVPQRRCSVDMTSKYASSVGSSPVSGGGADAPSSIAARPLS